ncbi:2-(1,2-epoxy-1,2-dihydrophenyl)acetyl-CoA isomerase [Aestuariicella hydrocarbonica]|uniref:2-(1,2-epoxy-1,2-dihydrophenyl)acetyl-CoA isomerase n=1 Tax=Pseudomaricurvus hydrocarbonicus TaxID=1470433 RepID=A0A9E5JST4_9GAMM|nr:enoyl-CoA hydratase-related protein [Aestuariicella hydrocarbonica]NHO66138.1 2-(1,2-epoxy-1,2-dihydrophenyl)acetyl-CoA isomerase [Aestuariicella hydrocarbonica]
MDFDTIEYTVRDAVATICLNRPERMNSFNVAMHNELRVALLEVKKNPKLRCLVLTSNGKAFSAGQDLHDRYELVNSGNKPELGVSLQQYYNPLVETLRTLPIPVIAAVNGLAAGAGVGVALACDIVLAAKSAKFVFAFAKVGLVPDSGCSWSLVNTVGLARARALVMLGSTVTAMEASDMGMIWRCVDDEELDKAIEATTQQLINNPALGLDLSKRALNSVATESFARQLEHEAQLQTLAGQADDYAEAVRAFVEKRPPNYTGH